MSWFAIASLGAGLLVVLVARMRSQAYAIFRGVTLGLHSLIAAALFPRVGVLAPIFLYLHAAVFVHSLTLIKPRLRPLWYRALVSIPSSFFGAGTLLAWPWALLHAFSVELPWLFVPYAVALVGVLESLFTREEEFDIAVADGDVGEGPRRHKSSGLRVERPLRIVQITDPHLGPFMSVERLRAICQRAVDRNPDLVLLTGDYLTMESQSDPALLRQALSPLAALPGRVYGCFGNHDHEAPSIVKAAFAHIGATLLIDQQALVETPAGPVQLVGFDFVFRDRKQHLERVCAELPRVPGALRLALLHDPGAFRHLPSGEADLVLSGHTHGGQVGLVSLGLPWTAMRLFVKMPDHGLWAAGSSRLYVHRGTGHYGFPLRVGVPAEDSLLRVHFAAWA
ncbi:MAG: metallophosphoesterase [Polyangiaceae bacterium]